MNEVELLRQQTAVVVEQMTVQIQQLTRMQKVQKGAWMMLLRHLSLQGYANLEALQRDLEMQSDVEVDVDLQDDYAAFAGAVHWLRHQSSA